MYETTFNIIAADVNSATAVDRRAQGKGTGVRYSLLLKHIYHVHVDTVCPR